MTADYLYGWIKECLDFFGLSWAEKDKIIIHFGDGEITAYHENHSITLREEK